MLECNPCGARAPDDAATCGACGEASWVRRNHAHESTAPLQPEPDPAATNAVVETPTEPEQAQAPRVTQQGSSKHRPR